MHNFRGSVIFTKPPGYLSASHHIHLLGPPVVHQTRESPWPCKYCEDTACIKSYIKSTASDQNSPNPPLCPHNLESRLVLLQVNHSSMVLKALTYLFVLVLCFSYLSISIVAAPLEVNRGTHVPSGPFNNIPSEGYKLILRSSKFDGKKTSGILSLKIGEDGGITTYNIRDSTWDGSAYPRAIVAKSFEPRSWIRDGKQVVENLRERDTLVDWGPIHLDDLGRNHPQMDDLDMWVVYVKDWGILETLSYNLPKWNATANR